VRFLVDESMGEGVAKILRHEGYNAKYVSDVGLTGRSDEDVFATAWSEDRVLVTHDPDFLDDRLFPPHRNPGVLLIRPGSSGRGDRGLQVCLIKALMIAAEPRHGFEARCSTIPQRKCSPSRRKKGVSGSFGQETAIH
jgi:predicted nuclease of predicted toxin-antitoxin system